MFGASKLLPLLVLPLMLPSSSTMDNGLPPGRGLVVVPGSLGLSRFGLTGEVGGHYDPSDGQVHDDDDDDDDD